MKKIQIILSAFVILFGLNTASQAEIGFGATLVTGETSASGSENMKGSTGEGGGHNAITKDADYDLAEVFIEYIHGSGSVIGWAHIPGEASLGKSTTTRTQSKAIGTDTVTQVAAADAGNHNMIYIETPFINDAMFVTAGIASVDITTKETLGTGAKYGDTSINGYMVGVGVKADMGSNLYVKASVNYTDYEQLNISSTGSDVSSTITADLDTTAAKVSLGFKF